MEAVVTGELGAPVDWRAALDQVDHVVHLAGLAHAGPGLDEALYQRVNAQATLALADAARQAGIGRLIYLSSIKAVTGAVRGQVADEDEAHPDDAYGRSKRAAELGLAQSDLDWVALRPVLVYGAGVKANMAALMRLARLPLPLPLGGLREPRSMLAVENLCSAIAFALTPSCPARRCYIVSDEEPVSVAEIVSALRQGQGRAGGLIALPPALLAGLARLGGRHDTFEKMSGGLVAPPVALLRAGWRPPVAAQEALRRLGAASAG
jgi:UDP-glucose 4-epimerase